MAMRTSSPGHVKTFDYVGLHRYEHILHDDEATMTVARYILCNPIRKGLVERVEDHPHVGSQVYPLAELIEGVAAATKSG